MTARSPIVGPAYQARTNDFVNDRCVNLYLELAEVQGAATPRALLSCPGLVLGLALKSPHRAAASLNGVLYLIAGNTCYAITSGLAVSVLGTLSTSTGTAYIEFNDAQVGFFDSLGLSVLTLATSVFAPVVLPFPAPIGVPTTLDTLTLLTQPGTYNLWQCNINDMTTWDPLNFTTEDGNAQPIVAIRSIHDTIVVLKTGSMCFYVNQGNPGFVFGRLEGIYARIGCYAAATVQNLGENMFWLGLADGTPGVFMLEGYAARRVSTYSLDLAIQSYSTVADAFAWRYSQAGHPFYGITFPTGNHTFVYDPKESALAKVEAWHERAGFAAGQLTAYTLAYTVQFNGSIYGGDANSGNLYVLNLNNFQDNGQTRKWVRSWRATASPASTQTDRCQFLEIQMDTGGLGTPIGTNPQLVLRQSFDGGSSWSAEIYGTAGVTGATTLDIRFRRLGATRRGMNNDRTFELSSTDVFMPALLGAEIG